MFCQKGILKDFTKFTKKQMLQSLFLIKLQASACNFIKKEALAQVFRCEFCEIFKNSFFPEHLRATASEKELFFTDLFATIHQFVNSPHFSLH